MSNVVNSVDPLGPRIKELFDSIAEAKHQHEAWAKDESLQTIPLDSLCFRSFERMIAVFTEGDMPAVCRKVEHSVNQFAPHLQQYRMEVNELGDPNHQPSRDFYAALQGIFEITDITVDRPAVRIETVKELVAQGLSALQIAKIKEWRDKHGNWDTDRVHLAKENPEKYDSDDRREKIAQDIQADLARTQALGEAVTAKTEAARPRNNVAPEAITALARSGMTIEKIALTLNMDPDDVSKELANFGMDAATLAAYQRQAQQDRETTGYLPRPNETESRRLDAAANSQGNVSHVEDADEDYDVNSDFDDDGDTDINVDDLTPRIMAAHNAGVKPGDIAKIIGGITSQKVTAIIKQNDKGNQNAA